MLLLGALGLFHAAPAQAQSTTLVSNIGQPTGGSNFALQPITGADAQGFTTGANAGGYVVTAIDAVFQEAVGTPANLRVELWGADGSGNPDSTNKVSLTVSSTVGAGAQRFAAPSGTTVAASTTYFVVFYRSGGTSGILKGLSSNSEDSGGESDWTIADAGHYLSDGTWNTWGTGSGHRIRVKGRAVVLPPTDLAAMGDGKLDVTWTAPTGTVTGYDVHYTSAAVGTVGDDAPVQTGVDPSAAAGWVAVDRGTEANPPATSQEITGLSNGTAYRVRVRASNSGRTSGWLHGTGTPTDTTGPSAPTFNPGNGSTVRDAGRNITLTFGEAIKKDNSGTDFGNSDLSSILTLKTTNAAGTDIPYTATINNEKTVITIDPSANLADGKVYVAISNDYYDENGNAGPAANATFTVTTRTAAPPSPPPEEPPPPVVTIEAVEEAVTEGGEARFTVSATPAPAPGTSLSVRVSVSQRGDFAASGEIGTHTFLIDESGAASFSVSTEDDAIDEPDGAVTATVGTGNGYTPHASENVAAVTVRDNDLPVVTIEAVEESISEGGAARFTVRATPAPAPGTSLNVRVRVSQRGDVASPSQTGPRTVVVDDSGAAVFSVSTEDDALHEQDGILTVVVEQGSGYTPHASSNSAAVTVRDNDPPPPTAEQRAWLLRFGRTVSQQVVDALQQRFSTTTQPGLELTLAGESLSSATPLEENHVLLSRLLGFEKVSSQELAQGSSFNFSDDGSGPRLSFWGSGALSSFNGSEDTFNLRGEVTTAVVGAEWSSERWRAGAALSHSRGSGSFQGGRGNGEISGALTGLFPYGRYALSPRLGIWATAGYGWGSLSHNPDGYALEYNPVATMSMGALGMEGLLLEGGSDGVTLTTTADLLVLQTSSQEVEGLPASDGNLSRFRLGLEATRPFLLSNGSSLSPSLELGIRQDRGDAETGFGMDLGASLAWSAPERGVSAVVKGRTLLSHGSEDFQEKGLALSFSWQPTPSERGVSLSLSHAVGGAAEVGMSALLSPAAIEVLDAASSDGERFEARLAYGFPFYNDRLTITPSVAAALSPSSRSYSLLWSLAPYAERLQLHGEEPWELSLEGERQEHSSSSTSPVDHSLKLLFSLPF